MRSREQPLCAMCWSGRKEEGKRPASGAQTSAGMWLPVHWPKHSLRQATQESRAISWPGREAWLACECVLLLERIANCKVRDRGDFLTRLIPGLFCSSFSAVRQRKYEQ